MDDTPPCTPDITRDEMLQSLHGLLAQSVQTSIKLHEHQNRLRDKIREIQANPNWKP